MSDTKTIPLGRYKHFKGNIYEVVALAHDCEDPDKIVVVYKSEYETPKYPKGTIWVRPINNFTETVQRDGESFQRFTKI